MSREWLELQTALLHAAGRGNSGSRDYVNYFSAALRLVFCYPFLSIIAPVKVDKA